MKSFTENRFVFTTWVSYLFSRFFRKIYTSDFHFVPENSTFDQKQHNFDYIFGVVRKQQLGYFNDVSDNTLCAVAQIEGKHE